MKRYIPFTYKMMVPYLILVLLTDIVIGYISYSMLIASRTEMAETNIRAAMEQSKNNMKYKMDEVQRISDTLFSSLPFQRAIQTQGDAFDIYLTMMDEIVPQLQAPLKLYGSRIRLMLYSKNPSLNVVEGEDVSMPIKRSDYYILNAQSIADRAWYQQLQNFNVDNIWQQVDTDEKLENLSHIRKLVTYSDYVTVIGYVRITTRLDELLGDFDAFPVEQGIILQLQESVTGKMVFQRGEADKSIDSKDYLSLVVTIPGTGYQIQTLVPYTYLKQDAAKLRASIMMVCAVSFAVMAFIGFIVARLSGRKMGRIIKMLRAFQDGSFQKRLPITGNDEFVQIADAFNVMAANIQELINTVYVEGLQKKQAELEALQAQINPHFLYNTLSTINSLANLGETQKVTEMVKGVAKFYRLTLNQGKTLIPLGKEVEQVETYLDIQRVKYADAFSVYLNIDPRLEKMTIIKLILQPFVENIFKHAWFGGRIAIRISGKLVGRNVELKVIDNGIGMKPEVVKGLLVGPSHSGGYGLKNVNERIKLRYGDEYGVQIKSIYGGGTAVILLLPAVEEHEEEAEQAKDA
ncbi:sensor histidine kinase YesM [Paenibacillus phyllosphaerae]|uniref:Sensor histidine kinase YesM n=1 Tax=Paenibacillus phyllosphaerae TaxID=274593 RepID=A0A7W5AVH9_9BACL|nr:sensor histidine kinase [Paenibacillus phyllosphaerae]MBB3109535.1 sensor histidine kinase YesM [Paenibacillus phyllosphaerae]